MHLISNLAIYTLSGYPVSMADMFNVETKDLKRLAKFFAKSPKLYRQTSAEFLTMQARQTERYAKDELSKSQIIRKPAVIKNNVKSWRARAVAIEQQEARAGSVRRERFTGWIEQEFGKRSDATRVPTTAARIGGSRRKVVGQRNRLRRGNEVRTPAHYKHKGKAGKSMQSKESSMLRQMLGDNYRGMIAISGKGIKGYKQGLYRFDWKRKKSKKGSYRGSGPAPRALTMVQRTGLHGTSPKRNRWLSRAVNRTMTRGNSMRMWTKALNTTYLRQLKRALK
jgi:hypothetical protein